MPRISFRDRAGRNRAPVRWVWIDMVGNAANAFVIS